ncbi:MAG: hypothetical protein ABSG85_07585 [Spirochaetia bacterium]|jgi:hypothetical protein
MEVSLWILELLGDVVPTGSRPLGMNGEKFPAFTDEMEKPTARTSIVMMAATIPICTRLLNTMPRRLIT